MNWVKNLITKLAQQGSINYLLKSNPSLFKEYQERKNSIIIPEAYVGEAGEILKKWIFYRSKQGDNISLNGLDVILVNPLDKAKSWFTNPNFTSSDLQNKNEEYHEKLKQTKNRTYISKYPITILKQYNNRLAWGRLETSFCRGYGDSLGHCGNIGGRHDNTQRIYTFYDTTTNIHYLTFIYHENGILGEAKAYGNSKPPIDKIKIINREDLQSVDAQEVYKDLLLLKDKDQYIWNTIKGAGHKPENNFGFEDLNEKDREEVKKERENIDDYFSHKKGKDSNELYFIEDGEAYLNKKITKQELKYLLLSTNLLAYENIYKYIIKFNLQNDQNILDVIYQSKYHSLLFAKALNFDFNKIPQKVLDNISLRSDYSFLVISELDFDLDKIPEKIIKSICSSTGYCISFATKLEFNLNKIPKEIIISISKDYNACHEYAEQLQYNINKIPKEIITGLSKSAYFSYLFIKNNKYNFDKIPYEIIKSVTSNSDYSFVIASNLEFDLNKIPSIFIEGLAKNTNNCAIFAQKLNFDLNKIPQIIINGILRDIYACYIFAQGVMFDLNKIPKEIAEVIIRDRNYSSIFYSSLKEHNKEIPEWIENYELV